MDANVLSLSTFFAASMSVFAGGSLIFDVYLKHRSRINRRIEEEFRSNLRDTVRRSSLFKDFHDRGVGAISFASSGFGTQLKGLIEQSGVPVTLDRFLQASAGCAVAMLVAAIIAGISWPIALTSSVLGAFMPWAYVMLKRRSRFLKLRDQLPEAFELMTRAVRAGHTMTGAFQMVSTELAAPLADEFAYCSEQQNLGLPPDVVLRDLSRRNNIMELQMFAVALLVQRQSGGNPVELLTNLSNLIRKRIRLVGKVRALTSEGRLQAIVLAVLPLVAFGLIYFLNKSYAEVLLTRPQLIVGVLAAQAVGAVWIRKIVNFNY